MKVAPSKQKYQDFTHVFTLLIEKHELNDANETTVRARAINYIIEQFQNENIQGHGKFEFTSTGPRIKFNLTNNIKVLFLITFSKLPQL